MVYNTSVPVFRTLAASPLAWPLGSSAQCGAQLARQHFLVSDSHGALKTRRSHPRQQRSGAASAAAGGLRENAAGRCRSEEGECTTEGEWRASGGCSASSGCRLPCLRLGWVLACGPSWRVRPRRGTAGPPAGAEAGAAGAAPVPASAGGDDRHYPAPPPTRSSRSFRRVLCASYFIPVPGEDILNAPTPRADGRLLVRVPCRYEISM